MMRLFATTIKEFGEYGAGIAGALAGLTALYVLGKRTLKAGKAASETHDKMVKLTEALTPEVVATFAAVAYQLKPNGGYSLMDKVNRIEKSLLRENAVRRAQINATGLAFWESDAQGRITFASDALAEVIGGTPEEILVNGWATFLHPEDRDRVFREWISANEQRRAFVSTHRFQHLDGQQVTVQAQSHIILDGVGEVLGQVGTLTPI